MNTILAVIIAALVMGFLFLLGVGVNTTADWLVQNTQLVSILNQVRFDEGLIVPVTFGLVFFGAIVYFVKAFIEDH